jgi:hypothetical protein
MSEGSTAGNAQGYKMYNHNAMGDSEVASFVGDRMKRADVPLLSVEGKLHFMPTQITNSATASKMPAGMHHSE